MATIQRQAGRDWRAAAFLLERRHKKDWGRHETIDATVSTQLAQDIERRLIAGREHVAQWAREHPEEKKS